MHTRSQNILSLIVILSIAVVLTTVLSGAALARSTFQSSPVVSTDTPVMTQSAATATVVEPPKETPTAELVVLTPAPPVPVATQTPVEQALPSGFLPAPTLTSPDTLLPLPSGAQPPLVGPSVSSSEPTPEPTVESGVPDAAQLIDNGIVALSYLWLCCGTLLLASLGLVAVWLARRRPRR